MFSSNDLYEREKADFDRVTQEIYNGNIVAHISETLRMLSAGLPEGSCKYIVKVCSEEVEQLTKVGDATKAIVDEVKIK